MSGNPPKTETDEGSDQDILPNPNIPQADNTDGGATLPTGTVTLEESEILFNREGTFFPFIPSLGLDEIRAFEARRDDINEPRQFLWDTSVKPTNVYLIANDAAGTDTRTASLALPENLNENFFSELDETGVYLNLSLFLFDEELESYLSTNGNTKYLALQVEWQSGDKADGSSISPYFGVVEGPADSSLYVEITSDILDSSEENGSENGWSGRLVTIGGSGEAGADKPNDGNDDTTETAAPETGDTNDTGENDSSNDSSDDGGSGGLSTGAIAGIAVGGAVVLIAICVLAWFFIRRRRGNKTKGRPELSHSPNPSNHYIGSKEGHDGGLNSPDSEDGANITQHTPLDPNAPRPRAVDSPASFTPYQDVSGGRDSAAPPRTNTSLSIHSGSPVEGGRRGIPERSETAMSANQNVAHLVEDGMTAEDIRRLEEEERQLDFEIERAGRR